MDLEVIKEYLPLYQKAALLTLRLGTAGILFSVFIGLICSLAQYFRIPVLKALAKGYVELSRNTPLIIQLFFIYYGLPKLGIRTDPYMCAVAGLAFLGGGYMSETFRSGLEGIDRIQTESAYTLGFTKAQTFRYIILPQAVDMSIPPFTSNVIFLLKETSVFSAVSVMDLMFTAKDLIGLYYNTTECLFLLVVFYLMLLLPLSAAGTLLESRGKKKYAVGI